MTLFLDVDGVFGDFDSLAWDILGEDPRQFEAREGSAAFWRALDTWRSATGMVFFEAVELMPDAMELFDAVKHLNPIFLTGAPKQIPHSHIQKQLWIRKRFGDQQPVITCLSKYKCTFAREGDMIIDDWPKHQKLWEAVGGIWIHHDNTKSTLEKLTTLGVI